jgi:hypothetical protein
MPLPQPQPDEIKNDFLDRCMGDKVMNQDYPDNKQRYAICNSLWGKKEQNMNLRKAIPSHGTATSASAWDGGQNEKNLKEGQDYSYYKQMYAWVDPDKDDTTKSAYKFPHHEVSADGSIGAANVRGCQSIIGILNGSMGGTDIPSADYQGVWNHAARHLKDADVEPAPLRSYNGGIEHRSFAVTELRVIGEPDNPKKIVGHAAVFNQLSEDLGGFREQIAPGAFTNTLKTADVRALFNHDPNYVLGRTTSGTLRLAEDETGLIVEIDPPGTQWANDLLVSINRSDITQMSFAFRAVQEQWQNGKSVRTLIEVELFDVSPVTYPAYPQTDVKLRMSADDITAVKIAVGEVMESYLPQAETNPDLDNQGAHDDGHVGRLRKEHERELGLDKNKIKIGGKSRK